MTKWLSFAVRCVIAVVLAPIPLLIYVLALLVGMWMFDGETTHGLGFYWRQLRNWVREPLRGQPAI